MSEMVREVTDASFEAEVLNCDQPVLVAFYAGWSAPCRMQVPAIEAVAEKYCLAAVVVKLNVDENPGVAQDYQIQGLPTLIAFKGAREKERVVGGTSKEALSRLLDKLIRASAA